MSGMSEGLSDHYLSQATGLPKSTAIGDPVAQSKGRAWVLQRNDFPHAVYFDEASARAECQRQQKADTEWREENKHVADVRVFWNVYAAALTGHLPHD